MCDRFMVNILAKARLKHIRSGYTKEKIITTCGMVDGEIRIEQRDIGNFSYCGYEEFRNYDIDTFEPIAKDEFEVLDEKGNKKEYSNFEIDEIIEIFEEYPED